MSNKIQFLLYNMPDADGKVQAVIKGETLWCIQMGLTTWKNAPEGRAVTGFFDHIEDLIERENTFNMSQFSASVNVFMTFHKYQILTDKDKISAAQAKKKADEECDIFNKTQRLTLTSIRK